MQATFNRPLLLFFVVMTGQSSAQQPSDYVLPVEDSKQTGPAWMLQNEKQYRWRPDEEDAAPEASAAGGSGWNQYGSKYPQSTDYADEPMGLPPGTYRRIEERHTVTPHHDGFRFRPLTPGEQERVRGRNQRQYRKRTWTEPVPTPNPEWRNDRYTIERKPSSPVFRPDKRLDERPGSSNRYSYPQGSEYRMFRPQP